MSKKIADYTLDEFLTALAERLSTGPAAQNGAKAASVTKTEKAAEPEATDDDEDESESGGSERRAELMGTNIRTLRKIAKDLGFDAEAVASADKETLVDNIIAEEGGADDDEADDEDEADEAESDEETEEDDESDDDDSEDDDEDEDEDDEDEELTREDLEDMSLTDLKKAAKEAGHKPADIKGKDQDALISLILGDEDEDDEVDDEDEDDDEDTWKPEDIKAIKSESELRALAKEWGVKVKKADKPAAIRKALIAFLNDDE